MLSFLSSTLKSQELYPCSDINLVIGQPVSQDCFYSTIPVWFEYSGNLNPAPTNFPVCNTLDGQQTGLLKLSGILTNAGIEGGMNGIQIVGVNSNYYTGISLFNDGSAFQIDISDGTNVLYFDFGDAQNPLFTIDVLTPQDENFDLQLIIPESIEYHFDSQCGTANCGTKTVSSTFNIPASSSCDPNATYSLEFFADLDANDIEYDTVGTRC